MIYEPHRKMPINLNDDQKTYVKKNLKVQSVRQMAKDLGRPRSEIEKYVLTLSKDASAPPARLAGRLPKGLLAGLLCMLTFAAYSNNLSYEFVWDDVQFSQGPLYQKNFSIEGVKQLLTLPLGAQGNKEQDSDFKLRSHYRPLQSLMLYLIYSLFGLNSTVYHLASILLQIIAAVLLFCFLLRAIGDQELAFWVSAVFAVHPVQMAAVSYISGNSEILALLFALSSFYFYHRSLSSNLLGRAVFLAVSSLFYFMCLLTKELMIVIPILFFFYAAIYWRARGFKTRWFEWVGYGLAITLYIIVRIAVMGGISGGSIGELTTGQKIFFASYGIANYLRLLFLPYGLHMTYQSGRVDFTSPVFLVGSFSACLLLAATWFSRNSQRMLFGWAWFWVFLLPVLNIVITLNGPAAEHWLYNALIGFFIVIVTFLISFMSARPSLRRFIEPFFVTCVLVLALTTFHSSKVWKNNILIFENVVKYTHYRADIYQGLADAYRKAGMQEKGDEALKQVEKLTARFART